MATTVQTTFPTTAIIAVYSTHFGAEGNFLHAVMVTPVAG
jgi:hypothetical protein